LFNSKAKSGASKIYSDSSIIDEEQDDSEAERFDK
jgi:hypothetical protein